LKQSILKWLWAANALSEAILLGAIALNSIQNAPILQILSGEHFKILNHWLTIRYKILIVV
jgi:hypothetical protein